MATPHYLVTAFLDDIHQIVLTPNSIILHYLVTHHFSEYSLSSSFGIIHNSIASTKFLVASSTAGLDFEARTKLNCEPNALGNQYEACQAGIPRSSNIAEGWHNGSSSLVSCAHPTVWKFLDAFRLEQALTDIKITSHPTRKPLEPRSHNWVKHD